MKIINCENTETTYQSINNILVVEREALNEIFRENNWDSCADAIRLLYHRVLAISKNKTYSFDGVYWFHGTRVPTNYNFNEGLLPLNEVVENIFGFLYSLIKDVCSTENWTKFEDYIYSRNNAFKVKIESNDVGPYANFIKDRFYEGGASCNFTECPEIVVDICRVFYDLYSIDLMTLYKSKTQSCIVVFEESIQDDYFLSHAIYYLCCKYNKYEYHDNYHVTFVGQWRKEKKVSPEKIIKVEWI